MERIINKIPQEIGWSIHNLIAHPVSEIFHLMSYICYKQELRNISNYIHDSTIPNHKSGEGRG